MPTAQIGGSENARQYLDFQGLSFAVATRKGITFACCADIDLGAARAMAFLDDLAARFEAEYQAKTTASWQLGHFNSVISQRAKFFSGAPTVRQQKPQMSLLYGMVSSNGIVMAESKVISPSYY